MGNSVKLQPVLLLLLAVVCWCIAFFFLDRPPLLEDAEASYPLSKTVQFRFEVKNETNLVQKDVAFSVYAPVAQTATQKVKRLFVSHDYTLETDRFNNQVMHFSYDQLAPYENRVVTVRAELAMAETANVYSQMQAESFLQPGRFIESDHQSIMSQALNLTRGNPLESAEAVYRFVGNRINYNGYVKEDRGALYALTERKGDCTEFSYLVTALARAMSIPSRAMGGYVYQGNATFKARDYHNWAEVFVDGAWRIVDAQNQLFMKDSSDFVAMRIITSESDSLLGNSHQFAYASDGVSIRMK